MGITRPVIILSVLLVLVLIMEMVALGTSPWATERINWKANNCVITVEYALQKEHIQECNGQSFDRNFSDSECDNINTCKMARTAGQAALGTGVLSVLLGVFAVATVLAIHWKKPERASMALMITAVMVILAAILALLGCAIYNGEKPKDTDIEDRVKMFASRYGYSGEITIRSDFGPSWILQFVTGFLLLGLGCMFLFERKQVAYQSV
jgi:hypothetical protein